MKLTTENTTKLTGLLNVASMCGIESIVIIDDKARGINPAKTCFLVSEDNLPKFPQKIGLGRLKDLQSRISVFADKSDVVIDAKESERGEITSLEVSSGRNKVQYRCQSTVMLGESIPKNVPDAFNPAYKIFINKDEMKMVLDAVRVMGSKRVTLAVKADRSVSFTTSDASNDNFTVALSTPAERITEDEDTVVQYYAVDVFSPVIKELMALDTAVVQMGERGTLTAKINQHNVVLLPQVNDDGDDE